jgi:hypothetical protein
VSWSLGRGIYMEILPGIWVVGYHSSHDLAPQLPWLCIWQLHDEGSLPLFGCGVATYSWRGGESNNFFDEGYLQDIVSFVLRSLVDWRGIDCCRSPGTRTASSCMARGSSCTAGRYIRTGNFTSRRSPKILYAQALNT